MNTILYIRQSKDSKNAEESLAGQEHECRNYADNCTPKLEITQVLRDTVRGTKRIARRSQGGVLLDLISERECEAILLPSVDRLSRDTFAADDLRQMIKYLGDSGILWYFADKQAPFDYTSEAQVIDVLSELAASAKERVNITKRTMRKKRAMLSNKELLLTGKPPFGYFEEKHIEGNKVMRTWNIEPAQALIVKRIFDLYTSGTQVKELVKVLNSENAISPGARDWNTTALYRILNHEIYKGTFVWGKYSYNKKEGTKKLREAGHAERFDLEREEFRIVSTEVWERAQVIAKDNKTVRTPKEFLLRGHLFCECGERMIGNGNYYRCKSSKNGNSCGNGSLRKDITDSDIWSSVEHLINNPSALHTAIWESLEHGSKAQIERKAQAQDTRKAIATKNRELGNLGYSISKAPGERMIDTLLKQSAIKEQELAILEQELTTLESVQDTLDLDALNEQVNSLVWEAQEEIENLDYNGKRALLAKLNMKVIRWSKDTAEKNDTPYTVLVSIGGVS